MTQLNDTHSQTGALSGASVGSAKSDIAVPASLTEQLSAFRRFVWSRKVAESVLIAAVVMLLSYITVYISDRIFDTPTAARLALFLAAVASWTVIPWALYRWVWCNRRFDQLARLLRRKDTAIGDQLLGVIELGDDASEQKRSKRLVQAAMAQVAEVARGRDLTQAAPNNRLKPLTVGLGAMAAMVLIVGLLVPASATNAVIRFLTPWRDVPRYTFAQIESLPSRIVVPHGEDYQLSVALHPQSKWKPNQASMRMGTLPSLQSVRLENQYSFAVPPQTTANQLSLNVGDFYQSTTIEPKLRPEVSQALARVHLPSYLGRPEPIEFDVRSGTLAVVEGSTSTLHFQTSSELAYAALDASPLPVTQNRFDSSELAIGSEPFKLTMRWRDSDGLESRQPFELNVVPGKDLAPTVVSQNLQRQMVVLESEQINFEALAGDDFGIRTIGIHWRGLEPQASGTILEGEQIVAPGDPQQTSMQVPAVFCATELGIPAQPIELRVWAEDYNPNRERVYSPPHLLFVLNADDHAVWIASQMNKWHRAALDVRDKEMQLHERNKQLREQAAVEGSSPELQDELRKQSAAEASNGRRLTTLTKGGEDLLRQAARNPEIGVGHLDKWAEMLQILHDIGDNRMPSVSDLLQQASNDSKPVGQTPQSKSGPQVGKPSQGGGSGQSQEATAVKPQPTIPRISDAESTFHPNEATEPAPESTVKKNNGSKQGLATTTITGPGKKNDNAQPPAPEQPESNMDQAVYEQKNLLEEFEKIAEEMDNLLANLEGSTLVKRLKAASREQTDVATQLVERIDSTFGRSRGYALEDRNVLKSLSEIESMSTKKISYIMDDMQSYFERRRMNQFKIVLDDMRTSEVLKYIEELGVDIPKEQGVSISEAEYWADSLDRWADDLVDPACSGQCPGCKTSDSLPPSVILEVLRVLESEVNLREATRVADQARPAVKQAEHEAKASQLADNQTEIDKRLQDVIATIKALPDGEQRFPKDLGILASASKSMIDAKQILASHETGTTAIAAETEAIEMLLQCKRINPKGGGGGGSSPGGGGTGTTQDSAIALLGSGLNQNERRESRDVAQAVGATERQLPEEFRAGLDAYFNRLEEGK